MARGRKITLYLVDGIANGIIKGQIDNWVGLVTYGNITQLVELASDDEIRKPGVYILSGPDPKEENPEAVYIGESENVWKRITQHNVDEDKVHFERVAIVTSKDDNLTKGHILYLESRLIEIAHGAGRATVDNKNHPEPSSLPQVDRDVMEGFLEHLQLLLPVLGLNFILPPPRHYKHQQETYVPPTSPDSPEFSFSTTRQGTRIEVEARAQIINGEFVVLQGSTALPRIEGGYADLKRQLMRNGSLIQDNKVFQFTRDVPFNSPSAAAAVIRGQNTNGRTYWKLNNGMTYGDWEKKLIEEQENLS